MAAAVRTSQGVEYLGTPLVDPEVDQRWTSDQELDRLAPLVEALRHWAPVYDQWRCHDLARARPPQAQFGQADLSAVDGLRGIHFGQLAATSRRLRNAAAAAIQLAESMRVVRSSLMRAWRDGGSLAVLQRFDQLRRDVQDCATCWHRLGLRLENAIINTAAPVIKGAVDEILLRSDEWELTGEGASQQIWEQRISTLDREVTEGLTGHAGTSPGDYSSSGDYASSGNDLAWRAELDVLVTRYGTAIGAFRANLAAAGDAVTMIYQMLREEFRALHGVSGVDDSLTFPAVNSTGLMSTQLAAADPADHDTPASGSSFVSGGGGSAALLVPSGAPETGAGSSALLGTLSGEPPAPSSGGAKLASVSEDAPGCGAGVATAGAASSAEVAPVAGVPGTARAEDQQRSGLPWRTATATEEAERAASWERMRALLGGA